MAFPPLADQDEGHRDPPPDPTKRSPANLAAEGELIRQKPLEIVNIQTLQQDVLELYAENKTLAREAADCLADARERATSVIDRMENLKDDLVECKEFEKRRIKFFTDVLHEVNIAKERLRKRASSDPDDDKLEDLSASHSVDAAVSRHESLLAETGPSPSLLLGDIDGRAENMKQGERQHGVEIMRLHHELRAMESKDSDSAATREAVVACFSMTYLCEKKEELRRRIRTQNDLTKKVMRMYDNRKNVASESIRTLERAIDTCQARKAVLVTATEARMNDVRALWARARGGKGRKVRNTSLASEAQPSSGSGSCSPPANNTIYRSYCTWTPGHFYADFVRHIRETSDTYTADQQKVRLFLAAEVLNSKSDWCKWEGHLGEGGFGIVHKMTVPTLGETFALKQCKEVGVGPNEEMMREYCRESLITEMCVHSRVPRHPNIVNVVSMDDRESDHMYILYELGATDFEDHAWGRTEMPLSERMRLLAGVANGLDFLHQHGISHNDVKPANILVFPAAPGKTSGTTAKLADLGLALTFDEKREGQGTLGFKPPEVMKGKRVKCRADQDVFAIAHLLLITISKPEFKANNMFVSKEVRGIDDLRRIRDLEVAQAKKYKENLTHRNMLSDRARAKLLQPSHIYDELDSIAATVLDLIGKALAANPAHRPQMRNMQELMVAMSDCLLTKERICAAAAARRSTEAPSTDDGREAVPQAPTPGGDESAAPRPVAGTPADGSSDGGGDGGGSSAPAPPPVPAGGEEILCEPKMGAAGGSVVPARGRTGRGTAVRRTLRRNYGFLARTQGAYDKKGSAVPSVVAGPNRPSQYTPAAMSLGVAGASPHPPLSGNVAALSGSSSFVRGVGSAAQIPITAAKEQVSVDAQADSRAPGAFGGWQERAPSTGGYNCAAANHCTPAVTGNAGYYCPCPGYGGEAAAVTTGYAAPPTVPQAVGGEGRAFNAAPPGWSQGYEVGRPPHSMMHAMACGTGGGGCYFPTPPAPQPDMGPRYVANGAPGFTVPPPWYPPPMQPQAFFHGGYDVGTHPAYCNAAAPAWTMGESADWACLDARGYNGVPASMVQPLQVFGGVGPAGAACHPFPPGNSPCYGGGQYGVTAIPQGQITHGPVPWNDALPSFPQQARVWA